MNEKGHKPVEILEKRIHGKNPYDAGNISDIKKLLPLLSTEIY